MNMFVGENKSFSDSSMIQMAFCVWILKLQPVGSETKGCPHTHRPKWIPTIWFGLISESQTHTLRQQLWRCQSLQHLLILCFVRQRLACLLTVDCKDVVECISFSLKEGGPHRWMEFQLLARHLWSGQRLSVCLGYRSDTWACSLEPYTRSDGTFTGVKFGPQRPRGLTVNNNIYNLMTTVLESARDD